MMILASVANKRAASTRKLLLQQCTTTTTRSFTTTRIRTGTPLLENNNNLIQQRYQPSLTLISTHHHQQQRSQYSSSSSATTPSLSNTTIARVVGESTGGRTFAQYAVSFVVLHIAFAFGITSFLLFSEPSESQVESEKSAFRAVFLARQRQAEIEKLQGDELKRFEETGALPEEVEKSLTERVEQLVTDQMATLEQAKVVGSVGMILTACISTGLTFYFMRKFVSKIVFHSKINSLPNHAESMDVYLQSWNPFMRPKSINVQTFHRLTLVQPKSKKPQVAFTPLVVDHASGETTSTSALFYFSKDSEDALRVYEALNKSGLHQKSLSSPPQADNEKPINN